MEKSGTFILQEPFMSWAVYLGIIFQVTALFMLGILQEFESNSIYASLVPLISYSLAKDTCVFSHFSPLQRQDRNSSSCILTLILL